MADERDCVIDDNDRGQHAVEGNELIVDSKIEDAGAVRIGGKRGPSSGGGGKIGFDVVDYSEQGNPEDKVKRREICSMSAGEGVDGAEFALVLLKKDGNTVDADQIKTMRVTAEGIEFLVPVKFTAGGTVEEPAPSEFHAHDGKYSVYEQADLNLVVYAVQPDGTLLAVWDRWSYEASLPKA